MSNLLAQFPSFSTNHMLNRFFWMWGWFPAGCAFVWAARTKVTAVQAQRAHDERIIVTYRDLRESFPFSYRRKWREWVLKDDDTHYWWRKWEGRSLIEVQYCDDYLRGYHKD